MRICIFLLGMGVEGVAMPTLISRAVGAFIILALAAQHEYVLHITPRSVTRLERRNRAKAFCASASPRPVRTACSSWAACWWCR